MAEPNEKQPLKFPPPPEPFPGFGERVKAGTRNVRAAEKNLQNAEVRLISHEKGKWQWALQATLGKEWINYSEEELAQFRAGKSSWEIEEARLLSIRQDATRQFGRASWFSDFYAVVPNLVEIGAVSSLEDYLKLMTSDPTGVLSEDDLNLARETISRMPVVRQATIKEEVPEWLTPTPEQEQEIRKAFALEPRPPETIHRITVNALIKGLTRSQKMEMPEDWTPEQLLQFASIMDIPEEEMMRAVDYTELIKPYAEAVAEREAKIKAVLSGEEKWEMPELGFWQNVMFLFASPMQVAADVVRPWIENVSYPMVGYAFRLATFWSHEHDLDKKYEEMKALGYTPWQAMSEAYQEWNIPWILKLGMELVDPLLLIPGWGLSKPAALLTKIPLAATRKMGFGLITANRGLWYALDVPFDLYKAFWAKIPKTFAQAEKYELDVFRSTLSSAVMKHSGHIPNQMVKEDVMATLERAQKAFVDTPMKQNDVFVDLGEQLLRHAPLDEKSIKIWSRSLGGKLDEVSQDVIVSVEDVFGETMLRMGGPAENAKRIAIAFGIEDTPATIGKIIKDINRMTRVYQGRVARAIEIGKTATVAPSLRMTEYLVSTQKEIVKAAARSKYAKGKAFSGIVLSLMNKVDLMERSVFRTTLDRWLIRPTAEAYLGSVAYPIWNAFEGITVSLLEGVIPSQAKQEAFQMMFHGRRGVDSMVTQWSASDAQGVLRTMPGRDESISLFTALAEIPKGAGGGRPISLLPGHVPQKILGLKIPKWLAGKDYFEWTGKKWIELSDVWGTGLRANFLMRKMANFVAEYSYNVAGHDVNAAFQKLMGTTPTISKKALGLTRHELREEMFARLSTADKAIVLGMKDIMNNSSLMKGEALKILRQATELSPQAKSLGEQMIARDEVFGGFAPLIRKSFDWGRVGFGAEISELQRKKLMEFVDALPFVFKSNLNSIRISEDIPQRTAAIYNRITDTLTLHPRFSDDPEIFYHEFAHSIATAGSWPGNEIVKNYALFKGATKESAFKFRDDYSEKFARDFSKWVTEPTALSVDTVDFFTKTFPDNGAGMINSFGKVLADQSIADLRAFPSQAPDTFRFVADQIEQEITKVSSSQDLMQLFQTFEIASDSASHVPMKMLSQVMERADALKSAGKFRQLEELWKSSRADVENIVDSINESLNRSRIAIQSKSSLLTDKQQLAFNGLLERNTARMTLQEQFLKFDGRLLDDFWALPKAMRTREEHTALRAYRQENIINYKNEDAVLGAGDFLARKSYSALYHGLPKPRLFRIDATNRALSNDDVAKVMGANVDALTTGLLESMTFQDKPYFIQMIKQSAGAHPTYYKGFTEEKIGQVYDDVLRGLRMTPERDVMEQKILQQAESVKQKMITLKMTHSLSPSEEKALHTWVDDVANGMDGVFGKEGLVTPEQWDEIRQKASDSAHREYYKAFADYTNENIVDAIGKSIYPFWSYHLYRWFFLPRTFIRKPGVAVAWGKYYEYSDYGYQHIPGTDLEGNPAVGSAFGATFSLARHDFKSYYENLGVMGEVLDATQRRGFYPGIQWTLPIALTPVLSGRPPELGSVLPPISTVGLNLFMNSKIPIVASSAKWLKDRVFHENFHDYYTATFVSTKQVESGGNLIGGQSGVDLWFKKMRGEALSDEEQKLWDDSATDAAWVEILRSEFPQIRIRAEEMLEAYKQVTTLIEEQTGLPEKTQDDLWKHNLRPTDVIGGLSLDLQMSLDQMWQWRIYFGRGAILMPPEYSDLYNLMDKYYDKVESYQIERLMLQTDANKGFLQPTDELHFKGADWRREYANNWSAYTSRVESLDSDPEFADAIDAMTPAGQVRLAKELGFNAPPIDPMKEVIRLYFDIELLKKKDPYTGEEDYDYLRFWIEREAVRMALPESQRADFDTYIRRYQTPMEVLFKQVSREYLQGYRAVSRIVLEEFTNEEKALIAEFYADTTTLDRKNEIKDFVSHSGKQLISYWDSRRTQVRQALRRASPKLDFWLYVFGYTQPITEESKAMVMEWEQDRASIVRGITESPALEDVLKKVATKKAEEVKNK